MLLSKSSADMGFLIWKQNSLFAKSLESKNLDFCLLPKNRREGLFFVGPRKKSIAMEAGRSRTTYIIAALAGVAVLGLIAYMTSSEVGRAHIYCCTFLACFRSLQPPPSPCCSYFAVRPHVRSFAPPTACLLLEQISLA